MMKKTLSKGVVSIGSSKHDEVRAGLVVRNDDLDPTRVSALLRVAPTNLHRRGDPRIGRGGRVYAPFPDGLWELSLTGRRGERLEDVTERLLRRLPSSGSTWRRLVSLGRPTLWCAAFLKGSTVDLAWSAELLRRLTARHCGLRINVYGDALNRFTKRGIPLQFSISEKDVSACYRCIASLAGVSRDVYWIDVAAFDCVYAHTRPAKKSDPTGGNVICLKKSTRGWRVDEIVSFVGRTGGRVVGSRAGT
jgi:hypothetical protein